MALKVKHRCAVCWEWFDCHAQWRQHAVEQHGSVLDEFGWSTCAVEEHRGGSCPGTEHARRLPNYGNPPVRKAVQPQPFTARDGTTYTPLPLPLDAA